VQGIQAAQFRICRQIHYQKYGSTIFGVSGMTRCPLRLGLVNGALGAVIGLCVVWLKFYMITLPVAKHVSKLQPEVEFLGAPATNQDIFAKFTVRSTEVHR